MSKYPKLPYAELIEQECPEAKLGEKHTVLIALCGEDAKPAQCCGCGAWADDVPPEVYDEL